MTIGTLLPDVLAECGIDRTAPQISENTFEMRQILSLMNEAGRDINRRAEWAGATAEVTVTSAASSSLPSDFQRMASGGSVSLGGAAHDPVRPVVAPEMWQLLEKFPSEQTYYHIKNGQVFFSPAIGPNGATVRYVSNYWLMGSDTITSNADQPIFPDSLLARATIWRWKRQKGLPYDDVLAEFEADLETAIRADRGA